MRHKGLFVLAATAIVVGAAVPAAPAGAQEPLPLDVTPTSVRRGVGAAIDLILGRIDIGVCH